MNTRQLLTWIKPWLYFCVERWLINRLGNFPNEPTSAAAMFWCFDVTDIAVRVCHTVTFLKHKPAATDGLRPYWIAGVIHFVGLIKYWQQITRISFKMIDFLEVKPRGPVRFQCATLCPDMKTCLYMYAICYILMGDSAPEEGAVEKALLMRENKMPSA